MPLLEHPAVRSSALRLDEPEDAFRAWVDDPAKPDVVDLGQHREVAMVELSRRLAGSRATLTPSACAKFALPPGATIATAAAEMLHATIGPDGPRCRSFRSASYYLRGLARLDGDLKTITHSFSSGADDSRGPSSPTITEGRTRRRWPRRWHSRRATRPSEATSSGSATRDLRRDPATPVRGRSSFVETTRG